MYPTDEDYEHVGKEKYRQIEERGTGTVETRFKRKDGKIIYVLLSSTPLVPTDLSAGVTFTAFDITERKQVEEVLMRQQWAITLNNRIANVFLTSPPEEIYADVLEVILEALDSRFGYFGFIDDTGNLICPSMTRDVWDRCHVADKNIVFPRASWGGLWGRSLIKKRTLMANEGLRLPEGHVSLESALAVPIVHRDKLIGQFVVANKPEGYGPDDRDLLESAAVQSAPVLSALLEETSQRRRHEKLEEQYRQAQKMESIGRLAGGAAHDLNALLRKFERLLCRTIREDIAIRLIPAKSLPLIQGDVGQLEQVVMNLVVNAHDAMRDGGELTIETARVELDESYAAEHEGVTPGSYILLVVSDTGGGMDAGVHFSQKPFSVKALAVKVRETVDQ